MMNMQTKLYTIQFTHRPMTGSHSVPEQWSWNLELAVFMNFTKLPKKTELPEKFELRDQRGFKLTEKRRLKKKIPAPWPTLIYKLRMTSMVWSISMGQLGLAAWLCSLPAPAHLLISWVWETGEKVLDFIAPTENISAINIVLVPNPKYISYWEEN